MSMRDIGALTKGALARIPQTITAGSAGSGDNTEVDGPFVDRLDDLGGMARSCKVIICWSATLASGATLTIVANLQDAADGGGTPADHGASFASAVVSTGGAGGTTNNGVTEFDVDLAGARREVRLQSTADLSATGTDTCDIAAVFVFGDFDELPAS